MCRARFPEDSDDQGAGESHQQLGEADEDVEGAHGEPALEGGVGVCVCVCVCVLVCVLVCVCVCVCVVGRVVMPVVTQQLCLHAAPLGPVSEMLS